MEKLYTTQYGNNMQSIIPPPIKLAISEFKTGIVNVVWNQFFMGLYKLFSQPSYGYKNCSINVTGITGGYETDYKWISDRDFVHFYITITPTTKMAINNASVLVAFPNSENFDDTPIKVSNVSISLLNGNEVMDSRTTSVDEDGRIIIPNAILTRFTLKINGSFIKSF